MEGRSSIARIWDHPAWEWLFLVAITVGAGLLRFYALDTLPPGLYHDEAFNGLDALGVLDGRARLFFEANNGREPLFVYLLALSVGLWGRSPGALRIVSAIVGAATVPSIYWLGREMLGRRTGAIAAVLASTAVWTLNLSRVAFRAVVMVPVLTLALTLLWRGLRCRRWPAMIGAAVLYGLSFYTYLAVRFTPIALGLFFLYLALWHRELAWRGGWLLYLGLTLLVVAPLGVYWATHWQSALWRASQVSVFNPDIHRGDLWGTLLRHVWRTLGGFFYRGDFVPRHNVPLRPVFEPFAGLAFAGGLGLGLCRLRRQPAYGLILIWLGVMLVPTVLAQDAPHMLRASGVLPVLFLVPALGLATLWEALDRRGQALIAGGLVCLVLGYGALDSVHNYARHLRSKAVYYNFEAAATEMAVQVNRFLGSGWQGSGIMARPTQPQEGRQVYLAPRLWRDWASVRYLCPPSEQLGVLTSGPRKGALSAETLLVLWPFEDNRAALEQLPTGQMISVREGAWERGDLESESRLLYILVHSQPSGDDVLQGLDLAWEKGIRLTGYDVSVETDDELSVDLLWEISGQPVALDYTAFVHVLCDGQVIGQDDRPAGTKYYSTSRWRVGDTVLDRRRVRLDAPCAGERCELVVGLYWWQTMEHLRLLDASGHATEQTRVSLPCQGSARTFDP